MATENDEIMETNLLHGGLGGLNTQRRRSSGRRKSTKGGISSLDVLHDFQYKSSCKEITKLYRAANKLIKTLYVARTSMAAGDDNRAILCYNEVASVF